MDEWELEHFRKRLKIYYKGTLIDNNQKEISKARIAKEILNHCAIATTAQSINNCHQAVKTTHAIEDRDLIIQLLTGLVKDHYLIRDNQGNYQFLFRLPHRNKQAFLGFYGYFDKPLF